MMGPVTYCRIARQVTAENHSSHMSQRLHIGANDIANPADLGVTVDFVDLGLLLAKGIL